MPDRNPYRDDESGKYTEGYSDDDALDALKEFGGIATTSEVAHGMGCARRTAYNKLSSLEENGRITSRKSGRTRLWQIDDE